MKMSDLPSRIIHPLDLNPTMKVRKGKTTTLTTQAAIMANLPDRIKPIADKIGIAPNSVRRHLLSMEDKGLVYRVGTVKKCVFHKTKESA